MATLYISFVIPFAPIDKRAVMLKTLAMCVNIALLSRLFRLVFIAIYGLCLVLMPS